MSGVSCLIGMLPEPIALHRGDEIVSANEAFLALIGKKTEQDATKINLVDWLRTAIKSPNSFGELEKGILGGSAVSLDVKMNLRGTARHFSVSSKPVPCNTLPPGMMVTCFHDTSAEQARKAYWDLHVRMSEATTVLETEITNRKKVEEELKLKSEELQKINSDLDQSLRELRDTQAMLTQSSKMSALGEMAGGVAHEINNPLAIIKMRAEQLKEMIEDGEPDIPLMIETTDLIVATSTRIAKIINGLRSFSRDGTNDPFQAAAVQAVVEDTLVFCQEKLKNRNIPLDVQMPSEPLIIECRATEISQVLLNLISNALDAIPAQKEPWVKIDVLDQGEQVEILVTDSGPGIPDNIRDKIMQPFFTTKEIGKGTGLGLSISRGIIHSHHGDLSIVEKSKHTQFKITIPKAQKKEGVA